MTGMTGSMTTLLLVMLGVNVVALLVVAVLYRRARRAQRKRRLEAPNSQDKSQYVMDLESKERWESMELSRLHELNREEVEKILRKLRVTSVRVLTQNERAFLDRMVEAQRRSSQTDRGGGRGNAGARPQRLPGTP